MNGQKEKAEKPAKKKSQKKEPMTSEQKEELFRTASKVKSLKEVKNPVKGQLFKMRTHPGRGSSKDGRAKNLGETETVFRATGKNGFNKFQVVTSKKKKGLF